MSTLRSNLRDAVPLEAKQAADSLSTCHSSVPLGLQFSQPYYTMSTKKHPAQTSRFQPERRAALSRSLKMRLIGCHSVHTADGQRQSGGHEHTDILLAWL